MLFYANFIYNFVLVDPRITLEHDFINPLDFFLRQQLKPTVNHQHKCIERQSVLLQINGFETPVIHIHKML